MKYSWILCGMCLCFMGYEAQAESKNRKKQAKFSRNEANRPKDDLPDQTLLKEAKKDDEESKSNPKADANLEEKIETQFNRSK